MNWFLRFVGVLLIGAAGPKLRDPLSFCHALRSYVAFPSALIPLLGFYVPALELVVGFSLLLRQSMAGRILAFALFSVFTLLLLRARVLGLTLTCGCLGTWTNWLHQQPHGLEMHALLSLAFALGLLASLRPAFAPAQRGPDHQSA